MSNDFHSLRNTFCLGGLVGENNLFSTIDCRSGHSWKQPVVVGLPPVPIAFLQVLLKLRPLLMAKGRPGNRVALLL